MASKKTKVVKPRIKTGKNSAATKLALQNAYDKPRRPGGQTQKPKRV